ncbi:MAG TPA: hypothetical protein VFE05_16155 [Longimicrobiaceae bacterium]|jgi:hypothetical protein|nr:hypothetical protein [Longimicrobiaceae bacterium]
MAKENVSIYRGSKTGAFFRGVGRTLDMGGVTRGQKYVRRGAAGRFVPRDSEAAAADWQVVGENLRTAVEKVTQQWPATGAPSPA